MVKTTSSGMILIEKDGKEFKLSKINGFFHDTLVKTTSDYFGDLLFIAKCLDYDESKLDRGGSLKTNNVSITRTPMDKYDIRIGLDTITLCKSDMADLMKCLKYFDGRDKDETALIYGLEEDPKPLVRTIRDKKSFIGYSPSIREGRYGLAIERGGQARIYHQTNLVDWVDVFTLYDVDDIVHIKQSFCMVKDAMDWSQPVYISSHGGVFDYEPEYDDRFVKVSIGGELHLLGGEDVSDLIRVFDRMG